MQKGIKTVKCLKQISKHLYKLEKLNIYLSFILSNFNYCPLTWHFCGDVNTKKVEKFKKGLSDLSTATIAPVMSYC